MQELSCIIGNLFTELEPPCPVCEGMPQLTICGTTYTGAKAVLVIGADGFYYDGNPDDIAKIRETRCNNGATKQ